MTQKDRTILYSMAIAIAAIGTTVLKGMSQSSERISLVAALESLVKTLES